MANYGTITSDKKRKTALILCLLGGFLGLHRLYVGKIKSGLIFLIIGLVCVGSSFVDPVVLPSLLVMYLFAIPDLVKILLGIYKDNVGAHLREW